VFAVRDGVTDNVLEEDLENTTRLLVDQTGDALDTPTTSKTTDSGLGDTLDVVTKNLAMTLGAALAELCAADLASNGTIPGPFYVWNYGAPRVGNPVFAQLYTDVVNNTWRTIHANDIVPHLPLVAEGFQHVATEVWFPQTMTPSSALYTVCDSSGEDPTCSDSAIDLSVDDHLTYFGWQCETPCGGPKQKVAGLASLQSASLPNSASQGPLSKKIPLIPPNALKIA